MTHDIELQNFLNAIYDAAYSRAGEHLSRDYKLYRRRLQQHFVDSVINWPDGCERSKADFIVTCNLESMLPECNITFEGSLTYRYGNGDASSIEDAFTRKQEDLESALDNIISGLDADDSYFSTDISY